MSGVVEWLLIYIQNLVIQKSQAHFSNLIHFNSFATVLCQHYIIRTRVIVKQMLPLFFSKFAASTTEVRLILISDRQKLVHIY
jgi:hypothetical protein